MLWEHQVITCRTSVPPPRTSPATHLLLLGLILQHGGQDGELEGRPPSPVLDRHTPQLLPMQAPEAGEQQRDIPRLSPGTVRRPCRTSGCLEQWSTPPTPWALTHGCSPP